MGAEDLGVFLVAAQPFGGIVVAIPLAVLVLGHPWWWWLFLGPLLAYVQVPVIDLFFDLLMRWPWWRRLLERHRSARVERMMASGGGFWSIFLAAPLVGPWVVMAFLRLVHVPQRRAALPILLSMLAVTLVTLGVCLWFPTFFSDTSPR